MEKQNCWEFKHCKREPGGSNVANLGVCPAATEVRANGFNSGINAGRVCWAVAGTLCELKIQASFTSELTSCEQCDFFKKVKVEEGRNFKNTSTVPKWLITSKKTEKIKKRVILPIALILIVILAGAILGSNWLLSQWANERNRNHLNSVEQLFPTLMTHDAKFMDGQLEILQKNTALQQAWLKKDRELLLNNAQPIFSTLLNKYNVTHFYFHTIDKIAFLRVHNPPKHSDLISRFTLQQAVETGQPAQGIELGPLGTFTLRVVFPWMIDGKLSGFLELGMEINHITPEIKEALDVELFVFINKNLTTKAGWEDGLRIMGRTGDWNMLSDSIIIDQTMETIPQQLLNLILPDHAKHKDAIIDISHDGRDYYGGFVALNDASGNDVGDLIILTDVTYDKRLMKTISTIFIIGCLVFSCMIYCFFNLFLNRVEHELVESNDQIAHEMHKRLQTEKELRQEKKEREKLIQELQNALKEIKTLRGILPFCCVCGLIRDDTGVEQGKGEWMKVDKFVVQKTDAQVSHTYCPNCYEKAMEEDV